MYRRSITFGGVNSLTDLGILIDSELTNTADPEPRYVHDTAAYHDGVYNGSMAGGRIFYEPVTLTYVFVLHGSGRQSVQALRKQIINAWSNRIADLTDSDMSGLKYTNAMMTGEPRLEYFSRAFLNARLIVTFTADPYMQSVTGSRQRLTKWTASGNTARAVIDNHTVYPLVWLITPTISGDTVSFTVTADMAQSSLRDFCLFGLTAGAEVSSAVVVREQTPISGGVTMTAADRGALGAVQAGDVVYIYYTDDVTAAAIGCPTTTGTVFTIQNPKYRLEALTEGTPVLRINGAVQSILQAFTLSDTALLTVETSGYGYYELWHDDTEVRL